MIVWIDKDGDVCWRYDGTPCADHDWDSFLEDGCTIEADDLGYELRPWMILA